MCEYDLETSVYQAEDYFAERTKNIYLLNRKTGAITSFYHNRTSPIGRYCYFLSVLAILGLQKDDLRLCGVIDTMPREGYQRVEDYKHSWVEFEFNGEVFVYDCLLNYLVPKDVYYGVCKPRLISSKRTLVEVLKPYLSSQYAYRIGGISWQFKKKDDLNNGNGYIFSALQRGHLIGYFDGDECEVISFIADEPRAYE